MTTIVLLCAVCAALAGGVLLAYGICYGMFHLFRIHSIQAAQQRARRSAAQALSNATLITG